jgi:enamine deaminase RidA (YjgF/YER057c/UK114 family)
MMRNYLVREGFTLEDILRTWIYQGDIVGPEGETQRYKELNRARTDIFDGKRFLRAFLPDDFAGEVYPASTGIGADDVDVMMACLAMKTDRDDIVVKSLENPEQTSAFQYSACYSPKSPKFARAMAHVADGVCKVFVSGTASITHSETRHVDDAAAQTHQTLDNIEGLIAGANLRNHGIEGFDASLEDLALARVYVKRPEDVEACRAICRQRLGATPTIYTLADVCRPDLLVEIEGIVIARKVYGARS